MSAPSTFNQSILIHWSQWVGVSYDPKTNETEANWIRSNISPKLGYWADEVVEALNGWQKTGRRDFLNRNRDKFRNYMWLKVYEKGKHPELYFTLSIEKHGNGTAGLIIKLDFQRSSSKYLNPIQLKFLEEKLNRATNPACWHEITNYHSMSWKQLINYSTSFINKHIKLYYDLNDQLIPLSGNYRLARLCWNPNGWVEPSGVKGKSLDKNSHEYKYGFGHEEWIFDTSKLLDGYHYGFLEPIFKSKDKHAGNQFHIGLYTIDSESKNRYWIGVIKNVTVIDQSEADNAKDKYVKNGWYNEMVKQLAEHQIPESDLTIGSDQQLFNIKFRPEDMDLIEYELIPEDHAIYKIQRYTFIKTQDVIGSFITESLTPTGFVSRKGEPKDPGENSKYERKPRMVEVRKKHQTIQKALYQFLSDKYNPDDVTWEFSTEIRTQVDIVRRDQEKLIFYEIKTYPSLRVSIREAIGQLLEYAHWIQRREPIEFVIVTDLPINEKAHNYFRTLISFYNIPISYAWFNLNSNELVDYEFLEI